MLNSTLPDVSESQAGVGHWQCQWPAHSLRAGKNGTPRPPAAAARARRAGQLWRLTQAGTERRAAGGYMDPGKQADKASCQWTRPGPKGYSKPSPWKLPA